MKKITTILLAISLFFSMTGCAGSSEGEVKAPSNVSTDRVEEVQQDELKKESEKVKETIDEVVLLDESGIKITAKELDVNGMFGPEIKLLVENNSGKDLTFQCRNASVNGYMVDTMMSVDVLNGKKANESLIFMASDLEKSGIKLIADMEFSFHVFDMTTWETVIDSGRIQIKTSAAENYEYSYDDSGVLAFDGNGIKIIVKGLEEQTSFLGPSIVVYIENNSDKDITVQCRDVSINGFMVDALFSSDIVVGMRAIDTITFMESELQENDIMTIENVEMYFHIYDYNGWETITDTEVINLSF